MSTSLDYFMSEHLMCNANQQAWNVNYSEGKEKEEFRLVYLSFLVQHEMMMIDLLWWSVVYLQFIN